MSNIGTFTYTVRTGDSLWLLAQRFATTIEKIMSLNGLTNDFLEVGQRLNIPLPEGTFAYTVVAGDTLFSLAQKYETTVDEIKRINGLTGDYIVIGHQLLIPKTEEITEPEECYYIVEGDTLELLAEKYSTTVSELKTLNNLTTNQLCIGQELIVPCEPTTPPPPHPARDSLTYLFCGTSDHYLSLISQTQNSIKTVCPDFFELDDSGNLVLAGPSKLNKGFIDACHAQNIKVVPFVSNHWDRELGVTALLNRENLSSQIAKAVEDYNLDGVDVDIENVSHLHREENTDLIRLLRQKIPSDKIVSIAVAANPNNWQTGWHGSYDYKALSDYADYLMIMIYDESYFGGPEGPVSSSTFFNKSIQYAFNQEVPKEKIIAGIPFFGRFWKVGEQVGGYGIAARDVEYLLANYDSISHFYQDSKSALAIVTIHPNDPEPVVWGNRRLTAGTYHIWYDDEEATRYKLNTINTLDLRGVGSWALGQEILSIWDFYTYALNFERTAPMQVSIPPPNPKPPSALNSPPAPGVIDCLSN